MARVSTVCVSICLRLGLFTTGHILWLVCVVIPLLSVSLLGLPVDPDVMKRPQGKNTVGVNWSLAGFILWCYGVKFLPTVVVVLVVYVGILSGHCVNICGEGVRNCTCLFSYLPDDEGWGEETWTILTARLVIVFIVLLHFGKSSGLLLPNFSILFYLFQ